MYYSIISHNDDTMQCALRKQIHVKSSELLFNCDCQLKCQ
jgi:hypothetical protein